MIARTAEGAPIKQSGLSVAVLHRQPGGDWKMVIDNPHSARLLASQP
jgi:ketosteroid isomerase-like protein